MVRRVAVEVLRDQRVRLRVASIYFQSNSVSCCLDLTPFVGAVGDLGVQRKRKMKRKRRYIY
jgi:hypothetical protein